MSEQQDQSQKTEEPTEKKLRDAHKRGEVVKSQEVSNWFVLAAGAVLIGLLGPKMMTDMSGLLAQFLAQPHQMSAEGRALPAALSDLMEQLLGMMVLPLGVILLAAIGGNIIQHQPVFTGDRMKPKLDKISPMKGFKRIFGTTALVNFAKGIAKLLIVGAVGFLIIWPQHETLAADIMKDISQFMPFVQQLSLEMMGGVLAVLSVIAGLDFVYQKYDFMKRQKMTKQEIKDEHKQAEGDPHIRAKLRQIRMERGRQRMMAAVPDATVVIANPTHYAVALKYEMGQSSAPVCVAKGVDDVALRIRRVAEEHDVAVIENPPLARSLYGLMEIDDQIPPEQYKAVAEVISFVMRQKGPASKGRVTH